MAEAGRSSKVLKFGGEIYESKVDSGYRDGYGVPRQGS